MRNPRWMCVVAASAAGAVLGCGCAAGPGPALAQQTGESVVCVGNEPAALAWLPSPVHPLRVRSTYLPSADTVEYAAGRDYTVDYTAGTLRRTPESRLPDFRTNILWGREAFDHNRFPGYGNGGFFAYVDYTYTNLTGWPVQAPQAHLLPRTRARLAAGDAVTIVAFGDSITAGGDATKPELVFWNRWADGLRVRYPAARITVRNGATGGDSTVQGLERLETKVLAARPDLVLIGFGMNDHNTGGVPVAQFERKLKTMIDRIRQATDAEVILYSAFPPNPRWKFGTHRMAEYALATGRVAREASCAYADVFGNWQALAARKKPEDLLGNNINHPNDFGHGLYHRVLSAIGL
ncbi:MAG: SGNH/GDSL hydrolase family protein [Verrucomicrobia bacterium]|nr:SGNH/GDSL hydrolase family protein [Verrucomicrobiota bacterium]